MTGRMAVGAQHSLELDLVLLQSFNLAPRQQLFPGLLSLIKEGSVMVNVFSFIPSDTVMALG